jgi:hypothetical protein
MDRANDEKEDQDGLLDRDEASKDLDAIQL